MKILFGYLVIFAIVLIPILGLSSIIAGHHGVVIAGLVTGVLGLIFHFLVAERIIQSTWDSERRHSQALPKRIGKMRIKTFVSPRDAAYLVRCWPKPATLWVSNGWIQSRSDEGIQRELQFIAKMRNHPTTLKTWLAAGFYFFRLRGARTFAGFALNAIVTSWAVLAISRASHLEAEDPWLYALEVLWDGEPMRLLLVNRLSQL